MSNDEIIAQNQFMLGLARTAATDAYCPHSKFHVGACVFCKTINGDKVYIQGCNIENASFGLTICAERVAIFNTISQGLIPLKIAVSCPDIKESDPYNYKMPCGACRQVIIEHMKNDNIVLVDGVGEFFVKELLPTPFKF